MQTLSLRPRGESAAVKYDTNLTDLAAGDYVIIETNIGSEWAIVASPPVSKKNNAKDNAMVLRRADDKDMKQINLLIKSAPYAKQKAAETAERYKLDMKIISAHYTFSADKIIIYFSADSRIDFRELVKNLAGILRARIELRQIGSRDEVKIKGAIGCCGCECCCKRFLNEFPDSTIKMAKTQNIALNPDKINGMCGRIKCCLSYENDEYERHGCPKKCKECPNGLSNR
jgi:cell fate regulator YaaT (PSP1 superfamily)